VLGSKLPLVRVADAASLIFPFLMRYHLSRAALEELLRGTGIVPAPRRKTSPDAGLWLSLTVLHGSMAGVLWHWLLPALRSVR
jgi:hypothetical protein